MGLLILPIHYYTPANLSFTMLQLLLALALCSVANVSAHTSSEAEIFRQLKGARRRLARSWMILRYASNNFENLNRLHEEITTKSYSKKDLNLAWGQLEKKHGSYKNAQSKWWAALNTKVQEKHGYFRYEPKLLKEGRMGSAFEVQFRRNPQKYCLKLPSSFKGDVWEANVKEFAMAVDFNNDQRRFPCSSITDHVDIQHGSGCGSYILLPLLDRDLSDAQLSSDQALPMMEDLLMACRNLHEQMGRVHGDLLKANIMTTRHDRRFVVIDVLSEKEYNRDNIILDLKNIKDLPKLCFKADVKAVSDQIGHCIEAFVKAAGETSESKKVRKKRIRRVKSLKSKYFDVNFFSKKVPTITVNMFPKLVAGLNEPVSKRSEETVREQLGLPQDLSERINRLAGSIEEICEMSERIEELCKSEEDASLIAGKVFTEFFG